MYIFCKFMYINATASQKIQEMNTQVWNFLFVQVHVIKEILKHDILTLLGNFLILSINCK